MNIRKFIGDKAFYKTVLLVAVPIMIQNGITNFVSLLDNIMVGRLYGEAMSAVTIVNQYTFIFNLFVFGAVSGAGIFTAQFFGLGNTDGIRQTFRFKLLVSVLCASVAVAICAVFPKELISLYLHEGSADMDIALTLRDAEGYMRIMLWGFIPHAVSQVYMSTLRECRRTFLPMISSGVAVFVNLIFNYIFIFVCELGVDGAAYATVLARFVELVIIVTVTHCMRGRYSFIVGVYRSFYMKSSLVKEMILRGLPLMVNEFLWSLAIATLNQCYSTRGLDVVSALNIATTLSNVFNVVYLALGMAISIIVGNHLGAGELELAKETDRKMIAFSVTSAAAIALVLFAASPLIPKLYNIGDTAKGFASYMLFVNAALMPVSAFANAAYFTLRSGGRVLVTMLFDSVYMWVFAVPVAMLLTHFTGVSIYVLFLACQSLEIIKCVFGAVLVKKGSWVRRIVEPS